MTTDPLADALAELRAATKRWPDASPKYVTADGVINTILNAALSGDLMPRSDHLAALAAANEAAAWVIEPLPQGEDGRYFRIQGFHEEGCCHKDDTLVVVNRILVDRIRALTTADQQAALDRMIQAARAVRPLVWDADGRKLRMDDTMLFSPSYDWEGYELFRQEGYGLGSSYIIWPDSIGSNRWNVYGTRNGLYISDLNGEGAAKAAAQADYTALADGEPT